MTTQEKIAAVRERSGDSMQRMADKLTKHLGRPVHKAEVQRWCEGKGKPDLAEALAIGKTYGVVLESLLDPSGDIAWVGEQREGESDAARLLSVAISTIGPEEALARILGAVGGPARDRFEPYSPSRAGDAAKPKNGTGSGTGSGTRAG